MKTLSKEAENRLMLAIEKVASLLPAGDLSVTDAVAKVAAEMALPRGHLPLVCHAINTGRVNGQRKSASSILDKFAEIDLADAAEVDKRLYPEHVELPCETHEKTAVDPVYSRPPTWLRERSQQTLVKRALWAMEKKASVESLPERRAMDAAQACRQLRDFRNQVDRSRTKTSAARDQLMSSLHALVRYFKTAGDHKISLTEVTDNLQLRPLPGTAELLQYVAAYVPNEKTASKRYSAPFNWTSQPYSLVKTCLDAAVSLTEAQNGQTEAEQQLKEANDRLFPPKTEKQAAGLSQSIIGSAIGGFAPNMLEHQQASNQARYGEQVSALNDPEHDQALQNIQIQAMLGDLLSNDQVIRGYSPHEVSEAYNELSRMVPSGASRTAVMRPLLRRRLQSHPETFESQQMTELEKDLRGLRTQPPSLSPSQGSASR